MLVWILWLCNLVGLLPHVTRNELVRFWGLESCWSTVTDPLAGHRNFGKRGPAPSNTKNGFTQHQQHSSSICMHLRHPKNVHQTYHSSVFTSPFPTPVSSKPSQSPFPNLPTNLLGTNKEPSPETGAASPALPRTLPPKWCSHPRPAWLTHMAHQVPRRNWVLFFDELSRRTHSIHSRRSTQHWKLGVTSALLIQ